MLNSDKKLFLPGAYNVKVHLCRFENLPISLFSYENKMLKIPHLNTFTFWDMCIWDMWKVCLQTFRNNRLC